MTDAIPEDWKATSQSHGDFFEGVLKGDDHWRGACNHKRSRLDRFDIEAKFDQRLRIPTQVKVSGNNTFILADARRYYEIGIREAFRKSLAQWRQDGSVKRVWAVSEFIMHGDMMRILRGGVSLAEVSDCHDAIKELRKEITDAMLDDIQRRLARMHAKTPLLTFNPKIGTGNYRLQVSVGLGTLGRIATVEDRYLCRNGLLHPNRWVYTKTYGKRISLPLPIESGPRIYGDGSGRHDPEAYQEVPDLFGGARQAQPEPIAA